MVREEVKVYSRPAIIRSPYIVTLQASFQDEGCLYYVFDYISGGSLARTMERIQLIRPPLSLMLPLIRLWIRQLVDVLITLKQEGIVHRDLKPENILLDGQGNIRVTDFNSAMSAHGESSGGGVTPSPRDVPPISLEAHFYATSRNNDNPATPKTSGGSSSAALEADLLAMGGTLPYWAPERVALQMGTAPATAPGCELDVWSCGCVFYELLTGTSPFLRSTAQLTAERIMRYAEKGRTLDFPQSVGPLAKDLCLRMLDPNPSRRASLISSVASHPYFNGMNLDPDKAPSFPGIDMEDIVGSIAKLCVQEQHISPASLYEFTPDVRGKFKKGFWGLSTVTTPDDERRDTPPRVSFAGQPLGGESSASEETLAALKTSEELRDEMIRKLLVVLEHLVPVADGADVVDEAEVLTWGPLHCKFTFTQIGSATTTAATTTLSYRRPSERTAQAAHELMSLDSGSSLAAVQSSLTSRRSSFFGSLVCCLSRPSGLIMSRVKQWVTPIGGSSSPRTPSFAPTLPSSTEADSCEEAVLFGVLTGKYGFLLFGPGLLGGGGGLLPKGIFEVAGVQYIHIDLQREDSMPRVSQRRDEDELHITFYPSHYNWGDVVLKKLSLAPDDQRLLDIWSKTFHTLIPF